MRFITPTCMLYINTAGEKQDEEELLCARAISVTLLTNFTLRISEIFEYFRPYFFIQRS